MVFIARFKLSLRALRGITASLLPCFLLFVLARDEFLLEVCQFFGIAFGSSSFNCVFGVDYGGKAFFASRQLFWDIQTIWKIRSVGFLSLSQEIFDFRFELFLKLAGMLSTQSTAFGSVSFDLCPIETDFAKFQNVHLMGDEKNLDEKWR